MVKKVTPITGGGGDGKPPEEPTSSKVTADDLTSTAKALEGDLDVNEMPPEEIEKLSRAFGKMFVAEMRGEDIEEHFDPDELQHAVTDDVTEAIKTYCESQNLSITPRAWFTEQKKISNLFHPKQTVEGNKAYRLLAQDGHYHLNVSEGIFAKHRNYRGDIDKEALEKLFRRVDAEVRNMDPITREELLFTFINAVLGNDIATNYGSHIDAEEFNMVKPESRELLCDLAMLYVGAREHGRVAVKGYDKVNKGFNVNSVRDLIDLAPSRISNFPGRADSIYIARAIRPKTYYYILQLIRTLSAALPAKIQVAVDNALKEERGVSINITAINSHLLNPSKYLRQAFIALLQGRGSFETFFTVLCDFQNVLDRELNDRVVAARSLVAVYDSLGLDISYVIERSVPRILGESLI